MIHGAIELGVGTLFIALSTENWRRSPDEVRFLMGFNRQVIRRRRDELHAMGVRVRWAGRRPRLWRSVIAELKDAERMTAGNRVLTLQFCVNYGGRAEVADAARAIAREVAAGRLDPEPVDERTVARYLDEPDLPDVDLFVRSSGGSGPATSCSGSRRTRSWSSSTPCGPTSTGGTCGAPASSTPPATAGSAARSTRSATNRPEPPPGRRAEDHGAGRRGARFVAARGRVTRRDGPGSAGQQ